MTDKFRRTHPLSITFAEGEAPTGAKLTAVAAQARVGARLLEKAVGDLWNQSGDSILSDWPLQLPNLARMIGENKWLNPVLYPVPQQFTYRDNVGSKNTNLNQAYLQFKPVSLASVTAASGSTNLTDKKSNEYEVVDAGDWWVDVNTGRFRSFSALSTSDKLDYTVDSSGWATSTYTVPGVIPDPRQTEFIGCRISVSDGVYYIHLPPRRPLSLSGYDRPERYPSAQDLTGTDNQASTASPYKLFQGVGLAIADAHYRYPLPRELADILSSLSDGSSLPEGFLYLWNKNTGTIVDDATFKKSSLGDWIFQITAPSLDLANLVGADESQASYAASGLAVITAGTPLARAVWSLTKALYGATHKNAGDFSPLLTHANLTEQNPPVSSYSGHGGRYPTSAKAWAPSRWAMDDHVSLLNRVGSFGTAGGTNRDINDNAMLGHLVIANRLDTNGVFLDENNTNTSFNLIFGAVSGPGLEGTSKTEVSTTIDAQPPQNLVLTHPPAAAGSFYGISPGTYYIVITARDAFGRETAVSSEASVTTSAGEEIDASWSAVTGAATYRLYLGIVSGTYTSYVSTTGTSYVLDYYTGFSSGSPANPTDKNVRFGIHSFSSSAVTLRAATTVSSDLTVSGTSALSKTTITKTPTASSPDRALVVQGHTSGSAALMTAVPFRLVPTTNLSFTVLDDNLATGDMMVYKNRLYYYGSLPTTGVEAGFERVMTRGFPTSDSSSALSAVDNDATEVLVHQKEIPGGTLTTPWRVHVRVAGSFNSASAGQTCTIRLRMRRNGETLSSARIIAATTPTILTSASFGFVIDAIHELRATGPTSENSHGWTWLGTRTGLSETPRAYMDFSSTLVASDLNSPIQYALTVVFGGAVTVTTQVDYFELQFV